MADNCVFCLELVRPRQQAVSCDLCSKWQHRTCNTGITRDEYYRATKGQTEIQFTCYSCTEDDNNVSADGIECAAHSAMVESPPSPQGITFNLEFSTGSATSIDDTTQDTDITDTDTDTAAANEYTTEATDITDTDTTVEDDDFDVTREGPTDATVIEERVVDEPALTDTIIEDDDEVTFMIAV